VASLPQSTAEAAASRWTLTTRRSLRNTPSSRARPTIAARGVATADTSTFATAAWIGPLPLALSPVALVVLLGYSYTKRFTSLCHFAVGASLGLAPVGAWVAVRGSLELAPWLLGAAVMCWTAGFDIIYATQDREFDRSAGLRSLPARLGDAGALRVARLVHAAMWGLLLWFGLELGLGAVYFGTVAAVAVVLVVEHRVVRPGDLARVNRAFFHWNVVISVALPVALVVEGWTSDGGAP